MNKKKNFLLASFVLAGSMAMAQPRFGQPAYPISLPTTSGDTISLASLKGKVVLIDFWASWCGPCRANNKVMVKLYPKYKDKGFEILGVSLDDSRKDWMKAISRDRISWLQVIDPGGWDSPTALRWNLFAIPTTVLLDKAGNVYAVDLEKKDLEAALKELLGQ
jgi:peroxiredoxin